MKNKLVFLLTILILFGGSKLTAQQTAINLTVFEPLPEVSFMAFVTTKGLKNTPRIMQIDITPHGSLVMVRGVVKWRKINEASFNELLNFKTKPFIAKNFYNDDISSIDGIEIKESSSDDDLLQENLNKGKPTGTYKIIVEVIDVTGAILDSDETDINFLNPAQTLSIIEPRIDDVMDLAGITVTWTDVIGVSEFYVKANTRTSKFETLEEVLQRGNPLVNDRNVGTSTNVNLREILDRELVAGNEVVVQIRGSIPGPGGPTFIYSDIINFKIKGASTVIVDKGLSDLKTLMFQVLDDFKNNGEDDAAIRLQELLQKIQDGTISFSDLSIRFADGRLLSYAEFQELLDYLKRNPDLVRNIFFEEK